MSYSGFIYLWFDRKRKMYYVGSHMGRIDDGYICSSRWMRSVYKKRPDMFKRRIIEYHTGDRASLLEAETRWLSMIRDEEVGTRFYNLTRGASGGMRISTQDMSEACKKPWTEKKRADQSERMKSAWTPERRASHAAKLKAKWEEKGVDGYRDRDNHAASVAGKARPDTAQRNKEWVRSEATKAKMSQSAKARVVGSRWFTNGDKQCRYQPGNEPEGWVLGRVR